jgi:hypothetical protein
MGINILDCRAENGQRTGEKIYDLSMPALTKKSLRSNLIWKQASRPVLITKQKSTIFSVPILLCFPVARSCLVWPEKVRDDNSQVMSGVN